MTADALLPRAPFAGLAVKPGTGRGVIALDRDGLGLATVHVRRGRSAALAERVRERFGTELPQGPRRTAVGGLAFAGTGPQAWLAVHEQGGNAFAESLKAAIGDLASVSDQSDGYAVLRLTGPKLRETLYKIVPIDLHPRAFQSGDVVSTLASHIGATLWRLDDAADGSPVIEVAVFRSLAADFWHALSESAAEFGLVVAEKQAR
jgi:heterotetrameric sarcosine oxidase gamma subunit